MDFTSSKSAMISTPNPGGQGLSSTSPRDIRADKEYFKIRKLATRKRVSGVGWSLIGVYIPDAAKNIQAQVNHGQEKERW